MELASRQGNGIGRGYLAVGWSGIGVWCARGWRIFRVAPVRISLLALTPVVAEALVQLTPAVGIVLSKLVTPAVSIWALLMLDHKLRDHRFVPRIAGREMMLRSRTVAALSLASLTVFAIQVSVAAVIGNQAQALAFATGDIAGISYSRVEIACILVSGTIPMMFLFFVVPRMMLDDVPLVPAIVENARLLVRCWRPMVLYALGMSMMLGGLLWMPILLLVLVPAGLCVGYAAYREVFDPMPEA